MKESIEQTLLAWKAKAMERRLCGCEASEEIVVLRFRLLHLTAQRRFDRGAVCASRDARQLMGT